MFKHRVEQCTVRITAGMPHNQHLERCSEKELQQVMVVSCFQIPHRLDVFEERIVILIKDILIALVKFIAVAKDDVLWVGKLAMDIVVRGAVVAIIVSGIGVIETQQHGSFRE